jgi:hypothetical protein
MPARILVLADTLDVRSEALAYAVELAARTASSVVVLILVSLEEAADASRDAAWTTRLEATIREALTPQVEAGRKAGVSLEALLRFGVPSSELMKFLAESNTVRTIVWGGEPSLTSSTTRNKKTHWLAKIRDSLEQTVVIPTARAETARSV